MMICRSVSWSIRHITAVLVLLAMSPRVSADPPNFYRVIDLGVLPSGSDSVALGLNDYGDVVGWSTVDALGTVGHAFIWLRDPRNPAAGTMVDLDGRPPVSGEGSHAFDVNDQRHVAGEKTVLINGWGYPHGVVWYYDATGQGDFLELAISFPGSYGDTSQAFAINDDVSPTVVGEVSDGDGCFRGFRADVVVPGPLQANLLQPQGNGASWAYGLDNTGPFLAPKIVGVSTIPEVVCPLPLIQTPCDSYKEAVSWTSGGAPIVLPKQADHPNSDARDVNDNGYIVGWVEEGFPSEDCVQRAAVWAPASSTVTLLDPPTGIEATAIAINNDQYIVGWKGGAGLVWTGFPGTAALMWYQGPSGWEPRDLNQHIGTQPWTIKAAFDINDAGEIVGYGVRDGETDKRALLLIPH